MEFKNITLALGLALAAARGIEGYRSPWGDTLYPAAAFRTWALEMHRRQIQLLKIDWGNPGFCTEWDRDFDRRKWECRGGQRAIRRRVPSRRIVERATHRD